MKQKTVYNRPEENAKTAEKCFSWFSQSQPVSAVYAKLLLCIMLSIKLLKTNRRWRSFVRRCVHCGKCCPINEVHYTT